MPEDADSDFVQVAKESLKDGQQIGGRIFLAQNRRHFVNRKRERLSDAPLQKNDAHYHTITRHTHSETLTRLMIHEQGRADHTRRFIF